MTVYIYKNKFTQEEFAFDSPLTEAEMVYMDLVWSREEKKNA